MQSSCNKTFRWYCLKDTLLHLLPMLHLATVPIFFLGVHIHVQSYWHIQTRDFQVFLPHFDSIFIKFILLVKQ